MKYRVLLPPKRKLLLPDGHIKNTGSDSASLSIDSDSPGLREDMLTTLRADSTPLEQFKHAAEQYYLRKLTSAFFAKACMRLSNESAQVKKILPDVVEMFGNDQGFTAIQTIHQAMRRDR